MVLYDRPPSGPQEKFEVRHTLHNPIHLILELIVFVDDFELQDEL